MKKRKSRWGLVGLFCKPKTGVFYFRPQVQGKRKARSLMTKDHAVALERALKLQNQLPSNIPNSIGTLLDAYILAKRKEHSRFSSSDKHSILKRFADKFGECTPLESVLASDLEDYFKVDMEHLAESTLAGYESTIRAFLNWCQQMKRVNTRTLLECLDEFEYDFQPRENFLPQKEVVRLVKQCDQEAEDFSDIKYVIICAGFMGMRKNEIIESKSDWFNFETGFCKIKKCDSYTARVRGLDEFQVKNKKYRDVPISGAITEWLKSFTQGKEYVLASDKRRGKSRYRFDPKKKFDAFMDRNGVGHITLHDLRRSFATNLAINDVNIGKIAELIGDSIKTTEKNYAKYFPSQSHVDLLTVGLEDQQTRSAA
jgi:integrase